MTTNIAKMPVEQLQNRKIIAQDHVVDLGVAEQLRCLPHLGCAHSVAHRERDTQVTFCDKLRRLVDRDVSCIVGLGAQQQRLGSCKCPRCHVITRTRSC